MKRLTTRQYTELLLFLMAFTKDSTGYYWKTQKEMEYYSWWSLQKDGLDVDFEFIKQEVKNLIHLRDRLDANNTYFRLPGNPCYTIDIEGYDWYKDIYPSLKEHLNPSYQIQSEEKAKVAQLVRARNSMHSHFNTGP